MGFVAILVILMLEWLKGNVLKTEIVMSFLAMIYFVFVSVNLFTYLALTNTQNFLAVLFRLSQIYEMEEFDGKRVR